MKPVLFSPAETSFSTNGIGVLSDAISCRVLQELNGKYELELKYPIDGLHFFEIGQRSLVLAKVDPVSEPQPFRVYQITKPSEGVVIVRARHLAYDLGGVPVSPFTAQSAPLALNGFSANAATDCPFTFFTDKNTVAAFNVAVPSGIWSLLGGSRGGILDTYGGEYEFDRYDIKLWNRRGADRGVSIRYGKNLTSLEQDENCANCYTGVYPYWTKSDGQLVQLKEKIVNAPGRYGYVKVLPRDFSAQFQEPPTEDQLRAAAEKYIKENDIGKPAVSWKVEFVQLEQTEEYRGKSLLERVLLGDTVSVEFALMGVSATARVVAMDYDSILERYNSVTIGSVKANISDTIADQKQQIEQKPTKTDLEKATELATAWLTNGKGYAYFRKDDLGNIVDILFMDTQDINTAVNVMRVGQSGIGFSHNGVNGPYESAWTIDGKFNAYWIQTGSISASIIKGGAIEANGLAYLPPTYEDVRYMLRSLVFPENYPAQDFFDLNQDGVFDIDDVRLANNVFLGKTDISDCKSLERTAVAIKIEASNYESAILLSGKNMWGSDVVVSIGSNYSRIPNIRGNCNISGVLSVGGSTVIPSLSTQTTEDPKITFWQDNGNGTFTLMGRQEE